MPQDGDTTATAETTTETTATNVPVMGPDGKPLDPVRAAAAIERLRGLPDTVKAKDTQIAELQAKLKEHEDAKLSETEKLTNSNSELEAKNIALEHRIQELLIGSSARDAAAKAGAKYPDAVARLIDFSSIEFDKDGTPKNLDKVVKTLAESYPDMFTGQGPGRIAAGPRTPASGRDFNQIIREAAGRG